MNKTLSDLLNWRYATKKMDPTEPVAEEKVNNMLEQSGWLQHQAVRSLSNLLW